MNIIEHPLSRATVAESSELAVNCSELVTNNQLEDAYLNNLTSGLCEEGKQMTTAIASDRSKEKTEELSQQNTTRDNQFTSLNSLHVLT